MKTILKPHPMKSSGDATPDEVRDVATTSILYGVSGDLDKAKAMSRVIPTKRKRVALKAVDRNFSSELLKPVKTVNLSTDQGVKVYNPEKMVDNKSPEHVYEKRQVDFKTNLKKDLTNSFKVLESKELPLKFKSISFADKPQRTGEVMKSDLSIASIVMTDDFGNTHDIKIELPKINPNTGVFRLNGKQKCLVNQIVQNPITFPAPGESRFESSYSVFRIYSKSSPETLEGTNNQNWIVYYKDLDVTFKTLKKTDIIQTAKSGKHPNL